MYHQPPVDASPLYGQKTMTLEELEAEKLRYQGKLPFKLQMAWAKAKADRVNGVTHAPERSGADQHEVNILDD